MKHVISAAMLFSIALAGCAEQSGDAKTKEGDAKTTPQKTSDQPNESAEIKPANGTGNEVALTPGNTKIQFVGIHADPNKPDPRTGNFNDFTGKATLDGDKLTAVQVDIKTESLSTEFEKLTNHLKSADILDVREHTQATFQSTKIEGEGDTVTITGDLTLLGVKKSITFPATVSVKDELSLKAEFTIDRTEFGMDYRPDQVKKEVEMTVTVGP
jgi:polyisoprenoid-binding protein YceI